MSSDHSHDSHSDNGHDHDDHGHGQPAGDVIPETSVQDMLLKLVTVAAAVGLIGMFGWWWTLPLPEGHQAHEQEGQAHEQGSHDQSAGAQSAPESEHGH